ncbi:hypothetical protein CO229_00420 [Mycoplasmopsis bovirhinis]|nr:hypothetical protein CO229_00420 [Mycoplasmopsis bovirhinis]
MVGILVIIQFCYIRENYLKRKSYQIPFVNIFALLNGSTKDFFMRNKLKLNEEYFKIMMLLISRYDKYLKDCIYTDKSTKWNKILKIYTFFSGFNGFVFLMLMYEEYYISIIIFTIINCIFVFISFFVIYKVGNNKLTIPNYKSTELLQEWWLFNRELPDENYFHTQYSNFFY